MGICGEQVRTARFLLFVCMRAVLPQQAAMRGQPHAVGACARRFPHLVEFERGERVGRAQQVEKVVRPVVVAYVAENGNPDVRLDPESVVPGLAFVRLAARGEERGCSGSS